MPNSESTSIMAIALPADGPMIHQCDLRFSLHRRKSQSRAGFYESIIEVRKLALTRVGCSCTIFVRLLLTPCTWDAFLLDISWHATNIVFKRAIAFQKGAKYHKRIGNGGKERIKCSYLLPFPME